MSEYREEAFGVYAVRLFGPRACRSHVERLKGARGWALARVGDRDEDGRFHAVVDEEYRSAAIFFPGGRSRLAREFDRRVDAVVKPLVKRVWRLDLRGHAGTQVVRYGPGGRYGVHSDVGFDIRDRYVSVVCYLNDDFEGGGTGFPSLGYTATPEPGKALVFPSKYLHCAEPVARGRKYALVSWVLGPVPVEWI